MSDSSATAFKTVLTTGIHMKHPVKVPSIKASGEVVLVDSLCIRPDLIGQVNEREGKPLEGPFTFYYSLYDGDEINADIETIDPNHAEEGAISFFRGKVHGYELGPTIVAGRHYESWNLGVPHNPKYAAIIHTNQDGEMIEEYWWLGTLVKRIYRDVNRDEICIHVYEPDMMGHWEDEGNGVWVLMS